MNEIYKIKFAVHYLAMILSGIYLAYYLFSLVFSIAFGGFYLGVVLNINLVALVLFVYFKSTSEKYEKLLKE